MKPHCRSSLFINLAIAVVSIIVTFGSLELWARYRYFGGWLSEHGFYSYGKDHSSAKTTPIRIVCIGGSTTQGGGSIGPEQAYPFHLEEILNERLGGRVVEVLNSGISATATEYHRDFIKDRIDDQELDIIILHSLYNHFGPFFSYEQNDGVGKVIIWEKKVRTRYYWNKMKLAEILNVFLMEHSFFYTRLREKILTLSRQDLDAYYERKGVYTGADVSKEVYGARSEAEFNAALDSFIRRYRSAVEDIIVTARSRNVEVVLVIPPYPYFREEAELGSGNSRNLQSYYQVFERAKGVLLDLGKKFDCIVIDADSGLLERGRNAGLFIDSVHLNDMGNRIVADIVATELLERDPLFKKSGEKTP